VNEDGTLTLLGATVSDDTGLISLYTDVALEPGTHTLVGLQGTEENMEDITEPYTVTVWEGTKRPEYISLAFKTGNVTDATPAVDLTTEKGYIVVVSFKSTVYSQMLIADADNQILYAEPAEDLEVGPHTVTWYAIDPTTNKTSNPTQVSFNVTNEAFVSGQSSNTSPWTLVLGSIAVLSSLAAVGLYFRKKPNSRK
jgi:hypothetical protein